MAKAKKKTKPKATKPVSVDLATGGEKGQLKVAEITAKIDKLEGYIKRMKQRIKRHQIEQKKLIEVDQDRQSLVDKGLEMFNVRKDRETKV